MTMLRTITVCLALLTVRAAAQDCFPAVVVPVPRIHDSVAVGGAPLRLGLSLTAATLTHTSAFRELPSVRTCCPDNLTSSGSFGWDVRFEASYDVLPGIAPLAAIGLRSIGGRFGRHEATTILQNGRPVPADILHSVTIDVLTMDAVLGVALHPASLGLPLPHGVVLRAGIGFGLVPLASTVELSEQLLTPAGMTFENGSTIRNTFTGTLTDFRPSVGAWLSLGFRLPGIAPGGIDVEPTIATSTGLSEMARATAWTSTAFAGGVTLSLPLSTVTHIVDTLWSDSTVVPPPPAIHAAGITAGTTAPTRVLVLHATPVITEFRLPEALYFERNGSRIDPACTMPPLDPGSPGWRAEQCRGQSRLLTGWLRRLAARLRQRPGATLFITGHAGEETRPREQQRLASDRMIALKSFLLDSCDIPMNRVVERHSTERDNGGGEWWQRRVDLSSDDSTLFGPIIVRDTLRRFIPPTIRLTSTGIPASYDGDWSIAMRHGPAMQPRLFSGHGRIPPIDWDANACVPWMEPGPTPLLFKLRLSGTDAPCDIPIDSVAVQPDPAMGRTMRRVFLWTTDSARHSMLRSDRLPDPASITAVEMRVPVGQKSTDDTASLPAAVAAALRIPAALVRLMEQPPTNASAIDSLTWASYTEVVVDIRLPRR